MIFLGFSKDMILQLMDKYWPKKQRRMQTNLSQILLKGKTTGQRSWNQNVNIFRELVFFILLHFKSQASLSKKKASAVQSWHRTIWGQTQDMEKREEQLWHFLQKTSQWVSFWQATLSLCIIPIWFRKFRRCHSEDGELYFFFFCTNFKHTIWPDGCS